MDVQEVAESEVRAKASSKYTYLLVSTVAASVLASLVLLSRLAGPESVIESIVGSCRLWSPLGK